MLSNTESKKTPRPRSSQKIGSSNTTESTRVLIQINVKEYESRMVKHKLYLKSLERLIVALNEFKIVDTNEADKIIDNPIQFAENVVLFSKIKVNTMNLSYSKLIDVLEIDVIELEMLAREFKKLNSNDYFEPSIEDFKIYTNKSEQVDRFNALNGMITCIDSLKDTESDWNLKQLKSSLIKSMNGRLVSSATNIFDPIPNYNYVLNGRVYG